MRSRLMVRFHLRQLNCRGFPLNVLSLTNTKEKMEASIRKAEEFCRSISESGQYRYI